MMDNIICLKSKIMQKIHYLKEKDVNSSTGNQTCINREIYVSTRKQGEKKESTAILLASSNQIEI